jgi:hypothetical protein
MVENLNFATKNYTRQDFANEKEGQTDHLGEHQFSIRDFHKVLLLLMMWMWYLGAAAAACAGVRLLRWRRDANNGHSQLPENGRQHVPSPHFF